MPYRKANSRQIASVPLLILLAWIGAVDSSEAAVEVIEVRLDPAAVEWSQPFQVVVDGEADGAVELAEVVVRADSSPGELEIHLAESPCEPSCSPTPFQVVAEVDASHGFSVEEFHHLRVFRRDASLPDSTQQVFHALFAVGSFDRHPMHPNTLFEPSSPTTADPIRLTLAANVAGNDCGHAWMSLERIEREGNRIRVFVEYPRSILALELLKLGQAAAAGPVDPSEKCTPPGPSRLWIDFLTIDLGRLDAGLYLVETYLSSDNFGAPDDLISLPALVATKVYSVDPATAGGPLHGGRFQVEVTWKDFEGVSGVGSPVPGASRDSMLFTFFGPDNWELLVKVLNACGVNEKFWVLTAAATTVEYEITITDTVTGETWTYDNPLGFPSPAVTDIEAFDCSP